MAMTKEERKEAKRAAQKKYRDTHKAELAERQRQYLAKDENKAKRRTYEEQKRRRAGIHPRKVLTQDDYRTYFREYSARKRRESGVPVKKRVTDEQHEANRRARWAKLVAMFKDRPEDRKAIRRKSATKGRIADTLNVPLEEVPQELLEAYVLHLDVQRYIRRNK
jgi:hypothetical protein